MRTSRSWWSRGVLLWTLALLIVAIVIAVYAIAGLMDAQQVCFMSFPSVACPDGQDWRVGLLNFVFFGIPLIWLTGVVLAVAGRAAAKGRRKLDS